MNPDDNKKEQDRNLERLDYPKTDDIFNQEPHISLDNDGVPIEPDTENEDLEMGLDVPGSELDDEQQSVGSEDEENNYWSLGGDNHNDLEESENE